MVCSKIIARDDGHEIKMPIMTHSVWSALRFHSAFGLVSVAHSWQIVQFFPHYLNEVVPPRGTLREIEDFSKMV